MGRASPASRRGASSLQASRTGSSASRASAPAISPRGSARTIETISCDLLDRQRLATLPESPNVVYLAGFKFGASGHRIAPGP